MTALEESARRWGKKYGHKDEEPSLLNGDGGGGTYGRMKPASKDYVDSKFDLLSKDIAHLSEKLNNIPSWGAILGAVMIGVAAIMTALAFAGDRFDGGINLADRRQEQLQRDAEQDDKLDQSLNALNETFTRLDARFDELSKQVADQTEASASQ